MIVKTNNTNKFSFIVRVNYFFIVPVLLVSPVVNALTLVGAGQTENIDQATAPDNYTVFDGGVLNTSGANTFQIAVINNSTLNMVGGTVTDRLGGSAVSITNSQGSITGATLTSSRSGLSVNRDSTTTTGSRVVVTDSKLIGGFAGLQISGASVAELTNTDVTATGANSNGVLSFGGDVRATGGTITGQAAGVRLRADVDNVGSGPQLSLNGTQVQGVTGPAILVDSGATAAIELSNNASLMAGNGILLDVQGASIAGMTVADSALQGNINIAGNSTANLSLDHSRMTGDVVVEANSIANVVLQNESQLIGRLNGVNGVTINSQST